MPDIEYEGRSPARRPPSTGIGHGLAPLLLQAIVSWPGGPNGNCLVAPGRTLTAKQVLSQVFARADTFRKQGVSPQDVVLLGTGRGHLFWLDLLAVWVVGAVAVPTEGDPDRSRLTIVLEKAAPDWQLGSIVGMTSAEVKVLDFDDDDECSRSDSYSSCDALPETEDPVAAILFTSGTTGEPKGVVLSHRALAGNALAAKNKLGLRSTDTLGAAIPFRFVSALSHFLVCMLAGTCYAGIETTFSPREFIDYVLGSGCTAYGGSPLQLRWIAEWLELQQSNGMDPRFRIRWLMSSGDFFFEEIGHRLMRQMRECSLVVAYGLTEAAGRMCCRIINDPSELGHDGLVGDPIDDYELEAFDDEFGRCDADEPGRIFVRSSYLFSEYANDAKRTSQVMTDGWLETGDYGYKDRRGAIHLLGRTDEVFKVAGVKVSTIPIVLALLEMDLFTDVAVTKEAHPTIGSVPYAYIVLAPGRAFKRSEAMQFLRQRLPTSHLPWRFVRIDRIPRTGSGKLDRRALMALTGRR
jgi:long-chain acyl-CoA synthetase